MQQRRRRRHCQRYGKCIKQKRTRAAHALFVSKLVTGKHNNDGGDNDDDSYFSVLLFIKLLIFIHSFFIVFKIRYRQQNKLNSPHHA